MAPLTWREVSAPNFNDVAAFQRTSAGLLNDGLGGLSGAIGAFGKTRQDAADSEFLANISQFTDPAARDAAFQAGTAFGGVDPRRISPEALKFGMGTQATLLGNEASALANQGRVVANDQAVWSNGRTREFSDISLAGTRAAAEDAAMNRQYGQEARDLFASVVPTAADPADLERKLRSSNARPEVVSQALALAAGQGATLIGPAANPSSVILDQSLDGLLHRTEGGGGNDTLYGNAQRPGGQFAGVDVSKMTIDQALEFANPSGPYGQWVKSQTGKELPSTPMGRAQIVGSTLRDAAKEMGLSGDTIFDENTQRAVQNHLTTKRLAKADTMEGKRAELRAEWEGFKNVSDAELTAAIVAFEKGDTGALNSVAPQSPEQAASEAIAKAAGNQELINRGSALQEQAQTLIDTSVLDEGFDQTTSMINELVNRPGENKTPAEVANDLFKEIGSTDEGGWGWNPSLTLPVLQDEVNRITTTHGVSSDVAAVVLKNAVARNSNWFRSRGDTLYVDHDKVDKMIGEIIDPKTKGVKQEKLQGSLAKIRETRVKQNTAATLQQMNTQVEAAKQEYFNAVARQKERPGVDVQGPELRYRALQGQMEQLIKQLDQNPLIRANTNPRTGN